MLRLIVLIFICPVANCGVVAAERHLGGNNFREDGMAKKNIDK